MATEEEIRLEAELGTGPQPGIAGFSQHSAPSTQHSRRAPRAVAFLLDWFTAAYAIYVGLFVLDALIHALWLPSKVAANPVLDMVTYVWRQCEGVTTLGVVTFPKFLYFL